MLKKMIWILISIVSFRYISEGKNNKLIKNGTYKFKNTRIIVKGNNNKIIFGSNCNIKGLRILLIGNNNIIKIGNEVVINASKNQPTTINAARGTKIEIGDGSLLSNNIEIHTTDYHKIYDKKGILINSEKNIIIGKKVWIGFGSKILKGTEIGDNVVIGAESLIAGKNIKNNVIVGGNPAKIIKEDITWEH